MHSMLRVAIVLTAVTLLFSVGAGLEATAPALRLELGESVESPMLLKNNASEQYKYNLDVTTNMNNGVLVANIDTDNGYSDNVDITVGSKSTRTIPIQYTGAQCMDSGGCTGSATVTARNRETGDVEVETITVLIERPDKVYGAPGITLIHGIFAAFAAALVFGRYKL